MKKILQLFLTFSILVCLASCKGEDGEDGAPGPAGPAGTPGAQGPVGPQGPPGESAADSAQVFDVPEVTFTAENDYTYGLEFNEEFQLGPTDIMLAYRYLGTLPDTEEPLWSPLPFTTYQQEGAITYTFAHSSAAFFIILQSQFDLASSTQDYAGLTDNQVFRFVIIPGKAAGGRTTGKPLTKAELSKFPVDLNDYKAVIKYFKINDSNVRKIKLK